MEEHHVTGGKRLMSLGVAALAAALAYALAGALVAEQRVVLAVVSVAIVLWVSETIPLFVTALLASFLLVAWGGYEFRSVFKFYFDSVIVLFFGSFILARGLQKYGLDEAIAQAVLRRLGSSPYVVVAGMMGITAFLSMWMSNTAAVAIMIPIAIAILRQNGVFQREANFGKATVLAVAYAGTIGGIATLVGSPPNAIAKRFLDDEELSITFTDWLARGLPFVLVALVFTFGIVMLLNRPEIRRLEVAIEQKRLGREQWLVLGIFALTVAGWLTTGLHGLGSSTVALVPVLLLYLTGLLDESDLTKISWSTLLLFGGGLALGFHVSVAGIDTLIASSLKDQLSAMPLFVVLLALVFVGILVTMIASNTASAAILVPLMIPVARELGIDVRAMVMLIAISVSIDFMMPVGTPPNAIAYSTGLLRIKEMLKNGALINLGLGAILATMFYLLWI